MARFQVLLSEDADDDVLKSYEWGLLFWGKPRADSWLRDFYASVIKRLGTFPSGCAFAPESEFVDEEIRQYLFGRYRVLFEIEDDAVKVVRVVGPYSGLPEGGLE